MADAPATLRDGRYRGLREIGRGGQATTYEAADVRDGRAVAIKRFQVRGASSWKEVELAEREARVLAELHHPGIPAHVDHFEERGELYLVTELIEGESLAALRARGATLSPADVTRLLGDLADVLGYLHGRAPPIVHRDIKPANLVRRGDGRFVLVDFGAVRDRLRPAGGSTVVGTFGYMAPEQFQGRALPQSDVYGVGATVLTMITGQEPEALPHRGLAIDVRAALGSGASEDLVDALTRMLDPDPDRRATAVVVPQGSKARGEAPHGGPSSRQARPAGAPRQRDLRDRQRAFEEDIAERTRAFEREVAEQVAGYESSKRDRKAARRAEKAARRAARRRPWTAEERRARAQRVGWFLRAGGLIGLAVAELAVWSVMQMIVPFALGLLSLFFGAGLRRAATRVGDAGRRAQLRLSTARAFLHGLDVPALVDRLSTVPTEMDVELREARTRVADEPRRRVDVEPKVIDAEFTDIEVDPPRERSRR